MVSCMLDAIKARNKMQMGTFIVPFFCCIFCVHNMIVIPMVIMKEIVFACLIYVSTVYHQSEYYIPGFFITVVLMLFGKGYTHMVPSDWSASSAYFSCLRHIIHHCFGTILYKLYFSMNYFGIKWTAMQIYLYLWMYVFM